MRPAPWLVLALCLAWPTSPSRAATDVPADGGGIHGEVRTRDGETVRGAITWGGRASFWDQALSGVYDEPLEVGERTEHVEVFGLKIWSWKERDVLQLSVRVPFARIARIVPEGGDRLRVTLRDGDDLVVRVGPPGLVGGAGGVAVASAAGSRELSWPEIAEISLAPDARPDPRAARRIYGTVETSAGSFEGFVTWDRDETVLDDVLDGDEDEIPFRAIAEIRRDGAHAAIVVREDGTRVRLSGTNDVDDSNRGIEVRVEGLGAVVVEWGAFVALRLAPPPPSPARDAIAGGPIGGKVETRAGASLAGTLAWGDHERFAWEAIDGEIAPGIAVAIPFALVREVEPAADGAATVTLADGTTRVVRGDDARAGGRPIEVRGSGAPVRVPWEDVARVVLDPPR